MRDATYTDEIGRKYLVRVPEGVSDEDIDLGLVIGPPNLDELLDSGMSQEAMVRLHNQLFHRNLLTENDVRIKLDEVVAALQAALAVDAQTIHMLYVKSGRDSMPERTAPAAATPPEDIYGQWRKGPSMPSKQAERNPGVGASDTDPATQGLGNKPIPRRR